MMSFKYFLLAAFVPYVVSQDILFSLGSAVIRGMVDTMFAKWDRDHDGILEMGEAGRIFDSDDLNRDHILTLAEYEIELDHYGIRSLAYPIFNFFDSNHDGVVTTEDVSKYYHLVDTNSDGQVTRAEFDDYGTNVRIFMLYPDNAFFICEIAAIYFIRVANADNVK